MNIGKLVQKAKQVADKNGDKIAAGVAKATDFVDKKTNGKHHDKLEKIDDLAAKLDKTKGEGRAEAGGEGRAEAGGEGRAEAGGDGPSTGEGAPPAAPPA